MSHRMAVDLYSAFCGGAIGVAWGGSRLRWFVSLPAAWVTGMAIQWFLGWCDVRGWL